VDEQLGEFVDLPEFLRPGPRAAALLVGDAQGVSQGAPAGMRWAFSRSCAAVAAAGAESASLRLSFAVPSSAPISWRVSAGVKRWRRGNHRRSGFRGAEGPRPPDGFFVISWWAWRQTKVTCGPALSVTSRTKRLRSVASAPRYLPSVSLDERTVGHGRAEHGEELFAGEGFNIRAKERPKDRPVKFTDARRSPGIAVPSFRRKKSSMSSIR